MLENLFITVTNSEKKNYVKCNWVEGICNIIIMICMKNSNTVY